MSPGEGGANGDRGMGLNSWGFGVLSLLPSIPGSAGIGSSTSTSSGRLRFPSSLLFHPRQCLDLADAMDCWADEGPKSDTGCDTGLALSRSLRKRSSPSHQSVTVLVCAAWSLRSRLQTPFLHHNVPTYAGGLATPDRPAARLSASMHLLVSNPFRTKGIQPAVTLFDISSYHESNKD